MSPVRNRPWPTTAFFLAVLLAAFVLGPRVAGAVDSESESGWLARFWDRVVAAISQEAPPPPEAAIGS